MKRSWMPYATRIIQSLASFISFQYSTDTLIRPVPEDCCSSLIALRETDACGAAAVSRFRAMLGYGAAVGPKGQWEREPKAPL
jgi:hypothetical protein